MWYTTTSTSGHPYKELVSTPTLLRQSYVRESECLIYTKKFMTRAYPHATAELKPRARLARRRRNALTCLHRICLRLQCIRGKASTPKATLPVVVRYYCPLNNVRSYVVFRTDETTAEQNTWSKQCWLSQE